jgi:hypothetical protein
MRASTETQILVALTVGLALLAALSTLVPELQKPMAPHALIALLFLLIPNASLILVESVPLVRTDSMSLMAEAVVNARH